MKDWSDRSIIIVASGPSLTDEDVALVRAELAVNYIYVIVVNDNWRLLRRAHVLYAADHGWWTTYHPIAAENFGGELWTCDSRIAQHYSRVNLIDSVVGAGLPESRDFIKVGASSGTQAIQLAYIWGGRRIGLLGFDCQLTRDKKHWFGDHPPGINEKLPFERWAEELSILAKELAYEGIDVHNCSRSTALTCFPLTELKKFLQLPL